jgi:NTE family protein
MTPRRALVIGGGGVTGIAWATGMLLGLERLGIHLRDADVLVGTSAGSAVTAQVTGSATLEDLYARQVRGDVAELPGRLGTWGMFKMVGPMVVYRDPQRAAKAVGRLALSVGTEHAEARRAVIAARLDGVEWSTTRDLRIPAVDVDSGARVVFDSFGPASLEDAVLASCAVPGVWPVVTIDGRRYMDGGMSSAANVDLASDAERVIVLAPVARGAKSARSPAGQLEALGKPGTVVSPDQVAKAAIGSNPLDPEARGAAAEAGLAQAERVASRITEAL